MTNIIPSEAQPSIDALLDGFKKPEFDLRVIDTKYVDHFPISGVGNTTCLRWTIPKSKGNYVPDINKMLLALDLKITNKARTSTPPIGIESAPCNNFMFSIFSSLKISYGVTTVLHLEHFPIFSYMKMMLNCDDNDFMTWASAQCFYPEKRDEDLDNINTTGWEARRHLFGGNITSPQKLQDGTTPNPNLNKFAYSPKGYFFLSEIPHCLPSPPIMPCEIRVELTLNTPEYVFQSKNESHSDINFAFERARLFVPEIKLNEKLWLSLESKLAKEAMRQFFTTTQVNTFSIPTGTKKEEFDAIATGVSPSRIMLLFQSTDRLMGKIDKNSFKFSRKFGPPGQDFIIQSVKCFLKSEELERLNCDDSIHSFRDHYYRLYQLTRQNTGKNACSITFEDFWKHCLIFIFDLTATMNATDYPRLPLVKDGHLRITCEFSNPSTEPLTLISLLEVQSSLTIENSGKCTIASI